MSPIYIGKIIKTSQTYNGWKNSGVWDLYSGIHKTAEEEDDCKNQVMSNEHETQELCSVHIQTPFHLISSNYLLCNNSYDPHRNA